MVPSQVGPCDLPVLDLPLDRPRPPVQTFRGRSRRFPIDTRIHCGAAIRALSTMLGFAKKLKSHHTRSKVQAINCCAVILRERSRSHLLPIREKILSHSCDCGLRESCPVVSGGISSDAKRRVINQGAPSLQSLTIPASIVCHSRLGGNPVDFPGLASII
jgi:hypothetical protein